MYKVTESSNEPVQCSTKTLTTLLSKINGLARKNPLKYLTKFNVCNKKLI